MEAITSYRWKSGPVAVALCDDNLEFLHMTARPGVTCENIGIYRRDGDFRPWAACHQPSGIPFGVFRTRRGAKQFAEAVLSQGYGPMLDRAAKGDMDDWRSVSRVRALERQYADK